MVVPPTAILDRERFFVYFTALDPTVDLQQAGVPGDRQTPCEQRSGLKMQPHGNRAAVR